MERLPGTTLKVGEIIAYWPFILFPILNTIFPILYLAAYIISRLFELFKIDKVWDKFKNFTIYND
jgi:hypothetical protein